MDRSGSRRALTGGLDARAWASIFVLCAAAASVASLGAPEAEGEAWVLAHVESQPVVDGGQQGYLEEWVLTGVPPGAPMEPSAYRLRIAGEDASLRWDGTPGRCAVLRHWWPEVDHLQPASLEVEGRVVWSGIFGSGSGTPLPVPCR